MFGRQDNTNNSKQTSTSQDQDINDLIDDLNSSSGPDQVKSTTPSSIDTTVATDAIVPTPQRAPFASLSPSSSPAATNSTPSPAPTISPAPVTSDIVNLPTKSSSDTKPVDLADLKTKALDELYPIIHKLDLSAEDNFKTLMMMIQATDNKDLISQAYEAAEKIDDEAARAKALLDIVNEINYFTNHPVIDQ